MAIQKIPKSAYCKITKFIARSTHNRLNELSFTAKWFINQVKSEINAVQEDSVYNAH